MKAVPENVVFIHWHDLGRHLSCYGASGVHSPHLDQLANEGLLFTNAHATAPLCSPSRGSLFSGRYPHHNGLVGLAHHGFQYKDDVETLPALLGKAGWDTTLFGMQHESQDPKRLGFDQFDVSNSLCDYVSSQSQKWLHTRKSERPFFLTAGFFETHRPYPADQYEHAEPDTFDVPPFLPDDPKVRQDLAGLHGSIAAADAAVGRILDTLSTLNYDQNTWVIFITDHGLAFPRAKSTLYEQGTGVAFIVRPPKQRHITPGKYEALFSGVDLLPTVLELLGVATPTAVQGYSHAAQICRQDTRVVRNEVFTEKTYHDDFDPIRSVRTEQFRYIENYADRPALSMPLDIAESLSAAALDQSHKAARPKVELYDLKTDPQERHNVADQPRYAEVRQQLSQQLKHWRENTDDNLVTLEEGDRIAENFMQAYAAQQAAIAADNSKLTPQSVKKEMVLKETTQPLTSDTEIKTLERRCTTLARKLGKAEEACAAVDAEWAQYEQEVAQARAQKVEAESIISRCNAELTQAHIDHENACLENDSALFGAAAVAMNEATSNITRARKSIEEADGFIYNARNWLPIRNRQRALASTVTKLKAELTAASQKYESLLQCQHQCSCRGQDNQ